MGPVPSPTAHPGPAKKSSAREKPPAGQLLHRAPQALPSQPAAAGRLAQLRKSRPEAAGLPLSQRPTCQEGIHKSDTSPAPGPSRAAALPPRALGGSSERSQLLPSDSVLRTRGGAKPSKGALRSGAGRDPGWGGGTCVLKAFTSRTSGWTQQSWDSRASSLPRRAAHRGEAACPSHESPGPGDEMQVAVRTRI